MCIGFRGFLFFVFGKKVWQEKNFAIEHWPAIVFSSAVT